MSRLFHCIVWYWIVFDCIVWYYMLLNTISLYCMLLHSITWCCTMYSLYSAPANYCVAHLVILVPTKLLHPAMDVTKVCSIVIIRKKEKNIDMFQGQGRNPLHTGSDMPICPPFCKLNFVRECCKVSFAAQAADANNCGCNNRGCNNSGCQQLWVQ